MSCHLLSHSSISDIAGLKQYLFPGFELLSNNDKTISAKQTTQETESGEGWDEEWEDWNDESSQDDQQGDTEEPESDANTENRHKWLQECHVSFSPGADIIAIAKDDKLVLLTAKYNCEEKSHEDAFSYTGVWSGPVSTESKEVVTSLLCLPLASQKRSTQGAPDWTCIIVGFSTGYIRIYTETGTLILSQRLHTEPVQKLKCNTYMPPRYLGTAEQHEELLIMFKRVLVTIDGFSLFQALKACRNQVARATASGETSLQPPPLAYKKWAPQEMEIMVDCHTTGVNTDNPFDQMVTASMVSHTSSIRPTPPAASVYLISGMGPYTGFFYAVEGSAQPILSEVAYAVASKLKSAIMSAASGWLRFGGKNKSENLVEKPQKVEPATPLPLRFGLPDQRREGYCVALSPNNTFAATTDSFGRIILIDVQRGLAVRMWKGYRDAQVGWVEVREDEGKHSSSSKQSRVATFLVIYAARRGILEVWMMGNGPRVAAFNVSKYCKLIHMSHGILGLNNVTCRGIKIKSFQVALMDQEGLIKTVEVPFHLALSDKNNKRMRDMHLLKKLKQVLKENTEETETQVKDLLMNIKISSIAQQGVERLLACHHLSPAFMESILKMCLQKMEGLGEDKVDIEKRLFLQYCQLQTRLIHTYRQIDTLHEGPSNPAQANTSELSRLLSISETEVEHVISQVDRCHTVEQNYKPHGAKVRFQDDNVAHISGFLSCFSAPTHKLETDTGQAGHTGHVTLVKDLPQDKFSDLGSFIFERCLSRHCSADDLGAILRKSGIPMLDLGRLLLQTWLQGTSRQITHLPALFNMLKVISSNLDKSQVKIDETTESPWWHSVRHICSHSVNILPAYLAIIVSQAVAMDMSGGQVKAKNISNTETDAKDPDADTISVTSDTSPVSGEVPIETTEVAMETSEVAMETSEVAMETNSVSIETELWKEIIKQLEELLCVDCLLRLSPGRGGRPGTTEGLSVCVSRLLQGGKGCVTEVVARHVARAEFQPEDLYQPPQDPGQEVLDASSNPAPHVANKSVIWDQMQLLRKRFPHSLENDVLFANSCWEYTVLWNKQTEEVEKLKSGLEFLKLVQNAMLRQGVASLMWHMFLLKKFQAAALLMEKVGKFPKDRLCRKEVGVSENNFPMFINCIREFMIIIMEANCETNEVPVFNIEPLWSKAKGTVSLVELAIDQKATNYGLLKLHYQLVVLMYAILTFNMKSIKVISMFDSKGVHAFFKELHSHPLLPRPEVESTITVQRKQFLTRVLSQTVMKMREVYSVTTEPSSPTISTTRFRQTDLGIWPDLVMQLGEEFGLDIDYLKRHQVCELYSAGFDKMAEEVLLTVNDHESLGTQLLAILGQRVAHRLSQLESQIVVDLMANVNPALSTWLKSMNSKLLIYADVPVCDIQSLVTQTLSQLNDTQPEHDMAQALLELAQVL